MVHNFVGECSICHTPIRLRFQVSEGPIPVHFACPRCGTPIEGRVEVIDPELAIETPIKNGFTFYIHNFVQTKSAPLFFVEISPDFLTQKIRPESDQPEPTPFLRAFAQFGVEGMRRINIIEDTIKRISAVLPMMDVLYKLWINQKFPELENLISSGNEFSDIIGLDSLKDQVVAPIDCLLVLHQARELWYRNIYNEGTYLEIRSQKNLIFSVPNPVIMFSPFCLKLNTMHFNSDFCRKMLEINKRFTKIISNIVPAFIYVDSKDSAGDLEIPFSTETADEMMGLYEQMFEVVCEKSDIIIGLNNIFHRGTIDRFPKPEKTGGFEKTVKEYQSKYSKVNDLLLDEERFGCKLKSVLNRSIRNSIAHKDALFDQTKNTFEFPDRVHQEKGISFSGLEFSINLVRLFYKANVLFEVSFWSEFLYRLTYGGEKVTYGSPRVKST